MTVKPPSLLRVFTAVERRASPRIEEWVRSDLFLDTVTIANSVSRSGVRLVEGTLASALEAAGVPSARQVRSLQTSLERLAAERQAGAWGGHRS
jgi:hypothetical protein